MFQTTAMDSPVAQLQGVRSELCGGRDQQGRTTLTEQLNQMAQAQGCTYQGCQRILDKLRPSQPQANRPENGCGSQPSLASLVELNARATIEIARMLSEIESYL